jgi:hypothetical protein
MWRLCLVIVLAAAGLGVGLSWRPPAMAPEPAKGSWPSQTSKPPSRAHKVPAGGCPTDAAPIETSAPIRLPVKVLSA